MLELRNASVYEAATVPRSARVLEVPQPIRRGDLFHMPYISHRYVFRCLFAHCHPAQPRRESARHPLPESGHPHHAWVEVTRTMFDPPLMGYWMYVAPGSGTRFRLGRTIAFRGHREALQHFCAVEDACRYVHANTTVTSPESRIVARAGELGYDSVQFTRFVEHATMKAEVVFTRLNAVHAPPATRCHAKRGFFRPASLPCGEWPIRP